MSDEYEWDQSGDASDEASKEIRGLESTMATLRYEEALVAKVVTPSNLRWFALAAAAALLLGIGATLWSSKTTSTPGVAQHPCPPATSAEAWSVKILSGAPSCGDQALAGPGKLPVGLAIETDHMSRAELRVAEIGQVVLEPNSRLALQFTSSSEHRMQLDFGVLHAKIDAPPRLFLVQTPAVLAVDLGCEYTLKVSEEGVTELDVRDGYVSLEESGEDVYVPAGFMATVYPKLESTIPYAKDASDELVAATRDFAHAPDSKEAFEALLRVSVGPQDTLGLWHLLSRSGDDCEATVQRLRDLTALNPDPLRLGWGKCSDPARKNAWQNVLEPLWEI